MNNKGKGLGKIIIILGIIFLCYYFLVLIPRTHQNEVCSIEGDSCPTDVGCHCCLGLVMYHEVCTSTQNLVCCNNYHMGSGGIIYNTYSWELFNECKTPLDFIGGGKSIVNNNYCGN